MNPIAFFRGLSGVAKAVQLLLIALIAGLAVFVYLTIRGHNDIVTGLAARAASVIASNEATIATLTHANAENIRSRQAAEADYQRSQQAVIAAAVDNASLQTELARIQQENRDTMEKPGAIGCPIIQRTARELWPAK